MEEHKNLFNNRTKIILKYTIIPYFVLNAILYSYTNFQNINYTFLIPSITSLLILFFSGYNMKWGGGDLYHIIPISFLLTILTFPNILGNFIPINIQYLFVFCLLYLFYSCYSFDPKYTPDVMMNKNIKYICIFTILYYMFLRYFNIDNALYYTLLFSSYSFNLSIIYMIH